jgi:hypothetical protein
MSHKGRGRTVGLDDRLIESPTGTDAAESMRGWRALSDASTSNGRASHMSRPVKCPVTVPPAEELGACVDLPSPCVRRPAGSGLFPRSTLRGKSWPASCLALWQCRALAGDLGERGGLGYRPQSSSPSSATISRLRGRSAIRVTVAGSVASISQWRRAMLTGDKPRAASSCLVSLSKLARAPGLSASASIRARRAAVRVQPGGQAAL